MDKRIEESVRTRAGDRCEYCQLPQSARRLRFQIDHVIARQHGGSDELDNLALCCGRCNRFKGPNLSGVDPESSAIVRLFNPRQDKWSEHFRWDGATVLGVSSQGRATIGVLTMNHPDDVAIRLELIASDLFPPLTPK
jgi:hypothetical protein